MAARLVEGKAWSKADLDRRFKGRDHHPGFELLRRPTVDVGQKHPLPEYAVISTRGWAEPPEVGYNISWMADDIERTADGALNGMFAADVGQDWVVVRIEWRTVDRDESHGHSHNAAMCEWLVVEGDPGVPSGQVSSCSSRACASPTTQPTQCVVRNRSGSVFFGSRPSW